VFHFSEVAPHEESNYFSELYETYRKAYDEKMTAVRNATADFHPVQSFQNMVSDAAAAADIHFRPVHELRNLMAETGKTIEKAEESAMATATHMYETLVPAGSSIDKQLSAMTHATSVQMTEAWNSVKNIKQRLETARFLQKQRQRIRQQLKGYRELLNHMRDLSSAVPSKQMASMMRRITECNEAMERLENRAQTAFVQATGFALKNIPFMHERQKPQRFAKYSSDPLLGIATYPLGFHVLMILLTELPLRVLMFKRGFERRVIGPVAYYFHPGLNANIDDDSDIEGNDRDDSDEMPINTPLVFVHGIGLGLLPYMKLIDALLATGRPVLLPEIPYVTGFRPFQSPNGVLSPALVSSTMTAMLASHGFLKAAWIGHSYGTSWLSYMCKFARKTVAALVFLDPICFCLHVPYLTKQFVYLRPDPGTVSYMVRTDIIVNWTIQRSFPWAWVILFADQIEVPCVVFLSEKDALVPVAKVVEYFKTKDIPIVDVENCTEEFFFSGETAVPHAGSASSARNEKLSAIQDDASEATESICSGPQISCTIFQGDGHGEWTDRPETTIPMIVGAANALCRRVEGYRPCTAR
jgi:pimeloyl-ACP methyl ester carboxylesterase